MLFLLQSQEILNLEKRLKSLSSHVISNPHDLRTKRAMQYLSALIKKKKRYEAKKKNKSC